MEGLFLGGLLGLPGKLVAQLIVQGAQQPAQGIFVGLQGGDLLGRGQENAVEEVLGPVGVLEPVTGDSVKGFGIGDIEGVEPAGLSAVQKPPPFLSGKKASLLNIHELRQNFFQKMLGFQKNSGAGLQAGPRDGRERRRISVPGCEPAWEWRIQS